MWTRINKKLSVFFSVFPPFSFFQGPRPQPLSSSLHVVPASARWGNPSGSLPTTSRCRFPRLMSITTISTSSLRNGLGGSTGKNTTVRGHDVVSETDVKLIQTVVFSSSFQRSGGHHGASLQDADLWRPPAWLWREEEHVHSSSTAYRKRQGEGL